MVIGELSVHIDGLIQVNGFCIVTNKVTQPGQICWNAQLQQIVRKCDDYDLSCGGPALHCEKWRVGKSPTHFFGRG